MGSAFARTRAPHCTSRRASGPVLPCCASRVVLSVSTPPATIHGSEMPVRGASLCICFLGRFMGTRPLSPVPTLWRVRPSAMRRERALLRAVSPRRLACAPGDALDGQSAIDSRYPPVERPVCVQSQPTAPRFVMSGADYYMIGPKRPRACRVCTLFPLPVTESTPVAPVGWGVGRPATPLP